MLERLAVFSVQNEIVSSPFSDYQFWRNISADKVLPVFCRWWPDVSMTWAVFISPSGHSPLRHASSQLTTFKWNLLQNLYTTQEQDKYIAEHVQCPVLRVL